MTIAHRFLLAPLTTHLYLAHFETFGMRTISERSAGGTLAVRGFLNGSLIHVGEWGPARSLLPEWIIYSAVSVS